MTPEEALRHAYSADLARMPEWMRAGYDADKLVQGHLAGQPDPNFFGALAAGSPQYQSDNPVAMVMQDILNRGYTGKAWTPSQEKKLGREPEPYEFSPGGQHLDQVTQREKLYQALLGGPKPEHERGWLDRTFGFDRLGEMFGDMGSAGYHAGNPLTANRTPRDPAEERKQYATREYAQRVGRKHNYVPGTGPGTILPGMPDQGMEAFHNPENALGTFVTKMGPVLSEAAGQVGTALLRGDKSGETPLDALGNAAVRSRGADWNRTSPRLPYEPPSWRDADGVVDQSRKAYADSESLSSGDTFRSVTGFHVPYLQPFINGSMSILNGIFDGTTLVGSTAPLRAISKTAATGMAKSSVPGVTAFGRSTIKDMASHARRYPGFAGRAISEVQEEAMDPTTMAGVGVEFTHQQPEESKSQFDARMSRQDELRQQGIRRLEANDALVKRPEPYGIEGAVRRGGKAIGGLYNSLFGD